MDYWATEYVKTAVDLTALRRMTRAVNPAGSVQGLRKVKLKFNRGGSIGPIENAALSGGGIGIVRSPVGPTKDLVEQIRLQNPHLSEAELAPVGSMLDNVKHIAGPVGAFVTPKGGFLSHVSEAGIPFPTKDLTPQHKEFIERLMRAHETHLEGNRLSKMDPSNMFFGHVNPGVILGESNMVANAPEHLREGVKNYLGSLRRAEQSALRTSLPDFEYGKTVVPRAMRDHVERTLKLTPEQQMAHAQEAYAGMLPEEKHANWATEYMYKSKPQ